MTVYTVGPGDNPFGYQAMDGDTIEVLSGGFTDSALVYSGGTEDLEAGGSAYATAVFDGGVQNVDSGASVNYTNINAGGIENVFGRSDDARIYGTQNVSGGQGSGAAIEDGGVQNISDAGTETGYTIYAGGIQNLLADPGSSMSGNVYGTENVAGGVATSATVYSGGVESVSLGGTANSTQIESGGVEYVLSNGWKTVRWWPAAAL